MPQIHPRSSSGRGNHAPAEDDYSHRHRHRHRHRVLRLPPPWPPAPSNLHGCPETLARGHGARAQHPSPTKPAGAAQGRARRSMQRTSAGPRRHEGAGGDHAKQPAFRLLRI